MADSDAPVAGLTFDACADAALQSAKDGGAEHADVRLMRTRTGYLSVRDGSLEGAADDEGSGLSVRVLVDGCWGFASSDVVSVTEAARLARVATSLAVMSRPLVTRRVTLAPEPVHVGRWTSAYEIDPFDVPEAERIALLSDRSASLLAAPGVSHVDATLMQVRESTAYADSSGTRTSQVRVRLQADWTATAIDPVTGAFETMSTTAPPAGRGWEYLLGRGATVAGARPWDWDAELAQLPELLAEKLRAPSVEPGRYTLVIDPTNLWLTIHESIGHATELDRALGY